MEESQQLFTRNENDDMVLDTKNQRGNISIKGADLEPISPPHQVEQQDNDVVDMSMKDTKTTQKVTQGMLSKGDDGDKEEDETSSTTPGSSNKESTAAISDVEDSIIRKQPISDATTMAIDGKEDIVGGKEDIAFNENEEGNVIQAPQDTEQEDVKIGVITCVDEATPSAEQHKDEPKDTTEKSLNNAEVDDSIEEVVDRDYAHVPEEDIENDMLSSTSEGMDMGSDEAASKLHDHQNKSHTDVSVESITEANTVSMEDDEASSVASTYSSVNAPQSVESSVIGEVPASPTSSQYSNESRSSFYSDGTQQEEEEQQQLAYLPKMEREKLDPPEMIAESRSTLQDIVDKIVRAESTLQEIVEELIAVRTPYVHDEKKDYLPPHLADHSAGPEMQQNHVTFMDAVTEYNWVDQYATDSIAGSSQRTLSDEDVYRMIKEIEMMAKREVGASSSHHHPPITTEEVTEKETKQMIKEIRLAAEQADREQKAAQFVREIAEQEIERMIMEMRMAAEECSETDEDAEREMQRMIDEMRIAAEEEQQQKKEQMGFGNHAPLNPQEYAIRQKYSYLMGLVPTAELQAIVENEKKERRRNQRKKAARKVKEFEYQEEEESRRRHRKVKEMRPSANDEDILSLMESQATMSTVDKTIHKPYKKSYIVMAFVALMGLVLGVTAVIYYIKEK
eukprot:scaffold6189_cov101-Cylindrotheca_fusiformis.AAC.3